MRTFLTALLTVLLAQLAGWEPANAEEYRLASQDRLSMRVVTWDPEKRGYVRFEAVSGEYTIGADGILSIPLIGEVMARGQTTKSLAALLVQQLRRQVGLSELPDLGLEVIGHLPVYVLGDVAAPGSFPYRPGMTAQQALALAGGLMRPPVGTGPGVINDALRLEGEMRTIAAEITTLDSERQRLLEDLKALAADDQSAASVPASDGPAPPPSNMEGLDRDILVATKATRQAQSARVKELQQVLREQIARLSAQISLRGKQIVQRGKELEGLSSLKERGLVANATFSSLGSLVDDLEAKRLQLEIARLGAQQQLNIAERDKLTIVDDARAKDLSRLKDVDHQITVRRLRMETVRTLHTKAVEAGLVAPVAGQQTRTQYQITRSTDGAAQTFEVEPGHLLLPGDLIMLNRVDDSSKIGG
jgi:protein involved in polysaccharide export with SLBB domain